ncbi:peptidoglycan -binding protein [Propylenella binzhouense]|uniref:Peptidoglycan -binding protein n=1 Tax=Propylenella binzhouense TaxID=2555902 RepID=A0A964T472_9HYPH|nr:peptidoglycan -binding protein [Propylenella binzhouense]MYZ48118.1 peptidoglycan -binding protein [Propylenella binzhouense]
MAIARARRGPSRADYWPGFVDAMSTLLLVFIFLSSLFMLAQFFLSQEITGKDTVLNRLNSQINELTEMLALERAKGNDLSETLASLRANLSSAEEERDRLRDLLDKGSGAESAAQGRITGLEGDLADEKRISQSAMAQVELLNQQIAALRRQIGALESALEASESRDRESQTKIADLGRRLNVALAQRVQELSRYRSDFFGRLREILAGRSDVEVVGDRFVLPAAVLFPSGTDDINDSARGELDKLAAAIKELEAQIPPEINWVIRVDGHTDVRPLSGFTRFRSNWELSAARAIAVVRYLIGQGVSPNRLVAAGFGEYQPLDPGTTEEAYARNRRIELKLTER